MKSPSFPYILAAHSPRLCVCSPVYISSLDLFLFTEFFCERKRANISNSESKNKKENKQSENVNIGTFSALAHNRIPKQEMGKKRSREREKIWKSIGCKLAGPRAKRREKKEREIQNCGYKKNEKRARASTPIPIWSHTTARPHHFHSKQDQYKYCNETQPSPAVCISFFFLRAVGAESRATLKRRCSPAGWKRNGATASFSFLGTERNFLGTARGLELCYLLFIPFNKNR